MPRVNCNTSCTFRNPFNGGNRNICKHTKECTCGVCGSLSATPFLQDGCIDACNDKDNRPKSTDDYLRNFVGIDVLFNQYGILLDGTSIEDTTQGQAASKIQKTANFFKYAQVALIVGLGGLLGFLVYKRL